MEVHRGHPNATTCYTWGQSGSIKTRRFRAAFSRRNPEPIRSLAPSSPLKAEAPLRACRRPSVRQPSPLVLAMHGLQATSSGSRRGAECSFDLRRDNPDMPERARVLLDEQLPAAGFAPAEIDLVLNTHVDGMGWNVRPSRSASDPASQPASDPGWVPTFPKARYVWTQAELDRTLDPAGGSCPSDLAVSRDALSRESWRGAESNRSTEAGIVAAPHTWLGAHAGPGGSSEALGLPIIPRCRSLPTWPRAPPDSP